ncbi:Proteasome inhibitor PI31 subunit [Varanus komodoensis]|uniref:Proteasome inhibitor PI31 subunit n=1 Tax=Varanus komodoensis TaxID=61221 RepID=A0A8D2L605_VARKO|nr:proteasome inhibitor PI31 subunit [Varanus komodoensis]KAF7248486.1 Proteasome inhibitor PI31 subunit [Varanus komodoensis]
MAGLELLFHSVAADLSCPQDALVCYLHWTLITRGYRCLGAGDQPGSGERKSEMLPAGWSADKELYTLRYRLKDDSRDLLLKAIMMDGSIILNVMDPKSQKVADLTLKVADYVNPQHLADFDRVYLSTDELQTRITHHILSPFEATKERAPTKEEPKRERNPSPPNPPDHDPLWIPPRPPQGTRQPPWRDPMGPFAVGGEDLDPFGGRSGGMLMDPLHSRFRNPVIDPSSGLPSNLPPGSVPPGARFDPFGPPGAGRGGPGPDHLPPPNYDDMFM